MALRIPFPTGHVGTGGSPVFGIPEQARPCRGHRRLLVDETCLMCGRLPGETIDRTFADRAHALQRRGVVVPDLVAA